MGVKVWILVYAGDPVDLCKYRHASLFIRFGDELPDCGTLFHITGAQRSFQFEEQPGYNPLKSSKLRNMVEVGDISAQVSNVRFILATTGVRNGIEDADWNCQNWVGDALQKLQMRNDGDQRKDMFSCCLLKVHDMLHIGVISHR
ncbi:hypothetical protein ACO22_07474 [Paracoccidioides brasiliensis]|uniref:Uncharacterized protein n=1 Tax=Paracoccidioides brasiliensis TaxID=121759 RepID=A0A1D2J4H9_PARBR|nr:hypothetical protein ACO22_07474 [Paracoccidioides brasiliensis]